ncbi:Transcriptional regulator, AsnC family [Neorhizobium galegae bv. officinalis]|uniref:Transcriptional regulator, AsnC family n=1 Tax=Neorhizobium galegae bv. officinalis TaxID=323656 RepID=A0A0T7G0N6_NEOGA|nr:Lrp/AsnC family transcriptional regulator [Neorhizobium galegae]CDZ40803.1 Transcriptional regulator, AsnC family [Neorhizobium galegae bv. officinalis]CDZ54620.1 Transcriptional regulator, AsnC family [Neorhizobium galegae bv. officinalis]
MPPSTSRNSRSFTYEQLNKRRPLGVELDVVDVKILGLLQRDGRITKAALADAVGLSPSACFERVSRLEKKKVITSYHAHVNIKAIRNVQTFFTEILIKTHRSSDFSIFENYIRGIDEVIECYSLGGGIDYLLKIVTADVDVYQVFIDALLDANIGVDRYFTYIVTKPIKQTLQLPVGALLGNGDENQGEQI